VSDVAKLMGMSEASIWRRVADGRIESIKVGSARRITREALAAFVDSLKDS
jgi:excisionase family DNA binding protein